MNIFKNRATKAIAFSLAAVLQVYASGGFALAAPTVATVAPAVPRQTQGRLTTTGNNPVSVNGSNASTGETIFSGQQIQTPAGTTATVDIPGLGSVEVKPGSNVTLTFGDGKINVVVTSGDRNITVSGVNAKTGDTIFSGQTLQTPAGTGASIYLAELGRVDMAPGTSVTLSFGDSRVSARLAAGCAILAPVEGVEGLVETKAATEKTVSAPLSLCVNAEGAVVQNQQDDDDKKKGAGAMPGGSPQAPPPVATGGGLSNAAAILLTVGAVTAFAIIAHELISDSENPGASGCTPGPNNPSNNTPSTCT